MRAIGIALIVIVVAGYLAAALAMLGGLPALFVPGVVAGSVASIVLLALFFHPWLVAGFAIDAVLLWAVLANGWVPAGTGL
jgi:fructose-specific phosphotransferase system IIC component